MGIKLPRNKKKSLIISLAYFCRKFIPFSQRKKFKLFLELEWIFNRFSHEESFNFYSPDEHPVRKTTLSFLMNEILTEDKVLDLGSKYGDLSYLISQKAELVYGIDYEKEAISLAKKKYVKKNLHFVCDDAFHYLKTEKIDFTVLVLSHVLEHIDDPLNFLKMCKPYFKKIYIEVPDFDASYLNQYRIDVGSEILYSDSDHVYEFDRTEIEKIIEASGFYVYRSEFRYGLQKYWCKNV